MQVLQLPEWHGAPIRLQVVWRLVKKGRKATCELWSHQLGWELRLEAGGGMLRSEVFRDQEAVFTAMTDWRDRLSEKGWRS